MEALIRLPMGRQRVGRTRRQIRGAIYIIKVIRCYGLSLTSATGLVAVGGGVVIPVLVVRIGNSRSLKIGLRFNGVS
jgi:hypothetical protein